MCVYVCVLCMLMCVSVGMCEGDMHVCVLAFRDSRLMSGAFLDSLSTLSIKTGSLT